VCVDAQAPVVRTIRGATDQFFAQILSKSGWYLLVLAATMLGQNLSLQNINSLNWIVILRLGPIGGLLW
jgi:hypothetical protein